MKKYFVAAAVAAFTALSMSSCCTINVPQYCNAEGKIGTKVGEATSSQILFFWSKGGEKATLKAAAESAGITKIYHVERTQKNIVGPLVIKYTTRVYGD